MIGYRKSGCFCKLFFTFQLSSLQLRFFTFCCYITRPGNVTTKSEKAQLQATQLKSKKKFAKAATFSLPYHEEQVKRLFSNEVTNVPFVLTEEVSMYHSSKSDFLKRFNQIPKVILELPREKKCNGRRLTNSCNVISNRKSIKQKTIGEFSEYVFVELNNLSRRSTSVDIVCDLYPEGLNQKESTQIKRYSIKF